MSDSLTMVYIQKNHGVLYDDHVPWDWNLGVQFVEMYDDIQHKHGNHPFYFADYTGLAWIHSLSLSEKQQLTLCESV